MQESWCSGSIGLSADGFLKNPAGPTGLQGRGSLGLWGPNKAGDPVVVVDGETLNNIFRNSEDRIQDEYNGLWFDDREMYVRLIRRRDLFALAIPGGMVDPGESGLKTAIREFHEEAANEATDVSLEDITAILSDLGRLIYRGLVDDPRNTDDAWMETEAYLIDLSNPTGSKTMVTVPEGTAARVAFQHNGKQYEANVPSGLKPGEKFLTIVPRSSLFRKVQKAAMLGRAGDDAGAARWVKLADAAAGSITWHTKDVDAASQKMGRAVNATETFQCCFASHRSIIQLAGMRFKGSEGASES